MARPEQTPHHNAGVRSHFRDPAGRGTRTAKRGLRNSTAGGEAMDLAIWLLGMLLLALATLGLMVLFVEACDKV